MKNDKKQNSTAKKAGSVTRRLAFSAAALALGIITSEFLPTPALPTGGSITFFSMLFISLVGYWYGLGTGLAAAVAYGLLQFILDPKFIAVGQILLDYILAFGALGLSGFFSRKKHGLIVGYAVGVLGRYVFSVISGVIYYGMYAPDGVPVLAYSMMYQATYLLPEMVLTLIVIALPPVRKGLDAVKKTATGS